MTLLPRPPFGTAADQFFKIHVIALGQGDAVRVSEPMITEIPHRVGKIGRPYRGRLARRLARAVGLKPRGVQLVRGKIAVRGGWSPDWLLVRGSEILAIIEVKGRHANLNAHLCRACGNWLDQFEGYLAAHLVACELLLDGWRTAADVRHVLVADAEELDKLPENQEPVELETARRSWQVVPRDVLYDGAHDQFGQLMDEMIAAHYKGEVLSRFGALLGVTGLPPRPQPQRRMARRTLRAALKELEAEGFEVFDLRGVGSWNDIAISHGDRVVGVRTAVNPVRAWVLPVPVPAEAAARLVADEHVDVDGVPAPVLPLGDRHDHDRILSQIRNLLGLGIATEDVRNAA